MRFCNSDIFPVIGTQHTLLSLVILFLKVELFRINLLLFFAPFRVALYGAALCTYGDILKS
jgi:hypothetical protein